MTMPDRCLIDRAMAEQAVSLALPMIDAALDSREAGASGFLYVVIMKPGFTPLHGTFADATLYEHARGDPANWDADYRGFARAKAQLSWKTGMDTHAVQQLKPHLLARGDTLLWGSVVLDQIIVAASGADPWYDEAFAGSIAMCLRAVAKKAVAAQRESGLWLA